MSRLRHPIRSLKEPFGKAGLTVAVLALVLAMVGGAYAAGGLTKSQEKQVTKIAKKYAGKPGPAGPAGPAGATGGAGKEGPEGAAGKNGSAGAAGAAGAEGSPWTAGGTLPSGQTETGAWSGTPPGHETAFIPISFSIPLAAPLAFHSKAEEEDTEGTNQVHFILPNKEEMREEVEEPQTACPGTVEQPQAAKGNLCVYLGFRSTSSFTPAVFHKVSAAELGADTAGTGYLIENTSAGPATFAGTWAVTAP
jgi:hypothetical protein